MSLKTRKLRISQRPKYPPVQFFAESGILVERRDCRTHGSEFEGLQPQTYIAGGGVGTWTATVELTDAAGNHQRFVINTDLSAAEATIGEQLKMPGSLHNLGAIAFVVILLGAIRSLRERIRKVVTLEGTQIYIKSFGAVNSLKTT